VRMDGIRKAEQTIFRFISLIVPFSLVAQNSGSVRPKSDSQPTNAAGLGVKANRASTSNSGSTCGLERAK
jgi:hypothetical protein